MNRDEIKTLLPHREPMLLVDEAEVRGQEGGGIYHVRGDEWFLEGHFPGNPVVPGVILCEIMAQSMCLLLGERLKGKTAYYAGIDAVRFKKKVRPGDTVRTRGKILREKGMLCVAQCQAENQKGEMVCKGTLSFAIAAGDE